MALRCRLRISRPDAHAGLTAHTSWLLVTPARPLVHSQARSSEGSRPGGPSDGGDESPGADGIVSRVSRAHLVRPPERPPIRLPERPPVALPKMTCCLPKLVLALETVLLARTCVRLLPARPVERRG